MAQLPALDDFPYVGQEEDSLACVPACVEMVCEFLGVPKEREEIEDELDYSIDDGTPFEKVGFLSGVLALPVESVEEAAHELESGLPVIANLFVGNDDVLGYSAEGPFLHAVVMVGVEPASVLFFDPDSLNQKATTDPTSCDRMTFEQAWLSGWVLNKLAEN